MQVIEVLVWDGVGKRRRCKYHEGIISQQPVATYVLWRGEGEEGVRLGKGTSGS